MKIEIFALFLLSLLIFEVEARRQKFSLKRFTRAAGLTRNESRVLRRYKCKPRIVGEHDETVEQWSNVVLRCRDLEDNTISTVLCQKSCFNFDRCRKFAGIKSKPIKWGEMLVDGRNKKKKHDIKLPVACECVKKSSKRRKNKRKNRG